MALLVAGAAVVAVWYDDLRHSDGPPTGFYVNPFSGDPGDLVRAADAARVKSDLLRDGDVELQAFMRGDTRLLEQADTGNRLSVLRDAIARNDRQGVTERWQNRISELLIGRLADPRDSAVRWAAEERGTSTVEFVAKSGGVVIDTRHPTFDNMFWLVQSGDRFLIADAQLTERPEAGR